MEEVFEGVMIATASAAPVVSWEYTVSLLGLRYPARVFRLKKCAARGLDWGRNELIHWFLDSSNCLSLLLLDDDAVVHPDTIQRLQSWNKPVVSALSVQRKQPFAPVAWRDHLGEDSHRQYAPIPRGWLGSIRSWVIAHPEVVNARAYGAATVLSPRPDDALVEVQAGSAHCLLIDRDVLDRMGSPWFQPGISFYKEAGCKCYVDRSCVAGHIGHTVAGLLDFAVYDSVTHYEEE
jgi:hypothetical protein